MLAPGVFFSVPPLPPSDPVPAPSTCESIVLAVAAPQELDDAYGSHTFYQSVEANPGQRVLHRSHLPQASSDSMMVVRYMPTAAGSESSWRLRRFGQDAICLRQWCDREHFQFVLQRLRVWTDNTGDVQLLPLEDSLQNKETIQQQDKH